MNVFYHKATLSSNYYFIDLNIFVFFWVQCYIFFAFKKHNKREPVTDCLLYRLNIVNIVPHFCWIEDKEIPFYNDFNIIVLGLDSIEARSYINSVACSFLGAYFISLFVFMICFGVKLTVSFLLLYFLVLDLIHIYWL